eukprot:Hpha_TRINITY_DN15725_c3_g2::TRINITY_DN15725_c3_g2_i1::g.36885::m.36885
MEDAGKSLLGSTSAKVFAFALGGFVVFALLGPNASGRSTLVEEVALRRKGAGKSFGFSFSDDLRVEEVTQGGPAEHAGMALYLFKSITHVDGQKVNNVEDLRDALEGKLTTRIRFAAARPRSPSSAAVEDAPDKAEVPERPSLRRRRRAELKAEEEDEAPPVTRRKANIPKKPKKVAIVKREEEEEEDKEEPKARPKPAEIAPRPVGAIAPPPVVDVVGTPRRLQIFGAADDVVVVELGDDEVRKLPVWKSNNRVLFSSGGGAWMLGAEGDLDAAKKNRGEIKSASAHNGAMPQAVVGWQRLKGKKGKRQWTDDNGIKVLPSGMAGPASVKSEGKAKKTAEEVESQEDEEEAKKADDDGFDAHGAKVAGSIPVPEKTAPSRLAVRMLGGKVEQMSVTTVLHHNMPVWKNDQGTLLLFSTTAGYWTIGGETDFNRDSGHYRSQRKHKEVMPHASGAWMVYSPRKRAWRLDTDIGVGAIKGQAGVAELEPEDEPPTERSSVPKVLVVKAPTFRTILHYDSAIQKNRFPTWKDANGRYFFSTVDGRWMLTKPGSQAEVAAQVSQDQGELRSKLPHAGKMPHATDVWELLQGETRMVWAEAAVTVGGKGAVPIRLEDVHNTGSGEKGTLIRVLDVPHSGAASIECTFGSAFGALSVRSPSDATVIGSKGIRVQHVRSAEELRAPVEAKVRLVAVVVARSPVMRVSAMLNSTYSGDGLPRDEKELARICPGSSSLDYSKRGPCSRDAYVDNLATDAIKVVGKNPANPTRVLEATRAMENFHLILWERFDEGMWLLARHLKLSLGGYLKCWPRSDGFVTSPDMQVSEKLKSKILGENTNDNTLFNWLPKEYIKRYSKQTAGYKPATCTDAGSQCWRVPPSGGTTGSMMTRLEATRVPGNQSVMCAVQCTW